MRMIVFNTKPYEREVFEHSPRAGEHELVYVEPRLTITTAPIATGYEAVCAFVNDELDEAVLRLLAEGGCRLIALRSAGFNHVDLKVAEELGLSVVRVPAYSPHAIAEHTLALILALNRRIHRAYQRVRDGNFALHGLMGFDLAGRIAGVVGTGRIGRCVARILLGLGMRVLAHDQRADPELQEAGVAYVPLDELFAHSDVVTLHCPLTGDTHHLIDEQALARMRDGVMLINTSRGGLIDTRAIIAALKSGRIGYLGLDVYEEEEHLFFEDQSEQVIQDDVFTRLLTFPNVLITAHQAFLTREALGNIVDTTLANLAEFETTGSCGNAVNLS